MSPCLLRAGKTIFITALIHQLTRAAKLAAEGRRNTLPVFRLIAEKRLTGARLEPQPTTPYRALPTRIISQR